MHQGLHAGFAASPEKCHVIKSEEDTVVSRRVHNIKLNVILMPKLRRYVLLFSCFSFYLRVRVSVDSRKLITPGLQRNLELELKVKTNLIVLFLREARRLLQPE